MAMKSDVDMLTGYGAFAARSSYLRIAIPSWRWVGIDARPAPDMDSVSREEILTLFEGELGRKRRRVKLTEREEREKDLARSIRRALYPS